MNPTDILNVLLGIHSANGMDYSQNARQSPNAVSDPNLPPSWLNMIGIGGGEDRSKNQYYSPTTLLGWPHDADYVSEWHRQNEQKIFDTADKIRAVLRSLSIQVNDRPSTPMAGSPP